MKLSLHLPSFVKAGICLSASLAVVACSAESEDDKPSSPNPTPADPPQLTDPNEPPSGTDKKEEEEKVKTIASIIENAAPVEGAEPVVLPETVILNNAMAAARESGRPLLVDATGAWCGPCQSFAVAKRDGDGSIAREEFEAIYEQFDHLDFEEMFTSLDWYWGFLPLEVRGVPTFMAYDPVADKWHEAALGFGDLKSMTAQLLQTLDKMNGENSGDPVEEEETPYEELLANWQSYLSAALAAEPSPDNNGAFFAHYELFNRTASERPFSELIELIGQADQLFAHDKNHFGSYSDLGFLYWGAAYDALGAGTTTLEAIQSDYADFYEKIKPYSLTLGFHEPIIKVAAEQGVAHAASICTELREYVLDQFEVETAGANSTATCFGFESLAGVVDQEAFSTFLSSITMTFEGEVVPTNYLDPNRAVRLAPLAGNFELAVQAAEKDHSNRMEFLTVRLGELSTELEDLRAKLAASTDPEEQEQLRKSIEDGEFVLKVYEQMESEYQKVLATRQQAFSSNNPTGAPVPGPLYLDELYR